MTGYAAFAPFYDQVMGDRGREAGYVHGLIQRHRPSAASVLELACGTGAILQLLQPHYEVTGLDASQPMLDIAARKVPRARLRRADMTRFDLGETFDVVLCVFDSINHLVRFSDWERVFDRARAHLTDRGLFVFDVNTERKLAAFAVAPPWTQWFGDDNLLLIDVRDEGDRACTTWKVRVFEHCRRFWRTGSTSRTSGRSRSRLERIRQALEQALPSRAGLRRRAVEADDALGAAVLRLRSLTS